MTSGHRIGTMSDALDVARVNVQTWRCCMKGIISDQFLDSLDVEGRADSFRRRFGLSSCRLAIAEDDAGICGFADVGPPRAWVVAPSS